MDDPPHRVKRSEVRKVGLAVELSKLRPARTVMPDPGEERYGPTLPDPFAMQRAWIPPSFEIASVSCSAARRAYFALRVASI